MCRLEGDRSFREVSGTDYATFAFLQHADYDGPMSSAQAVRYKHWRLVSDNNDPWSLYDMRTDKTETTEVIATYPKVAEKMKALYDAWIAPYGDS